MQKLPTFSTATLVWIVLFITSAIVALLSWWYDNLLLFTVGGFAAGTCLIGNFISVIVYEMQKERARIAYNQKVKRAAEAQRKADLATQKAAEEERRKREREEWSRHHGVMIFPVKGVTYENDDGSSRQKHLAAVKDALDIGENVDIEFIEFIYDDSPAYRIEIDGIGIGNVPAEDVSRFAEVLPHIEKVDLSVEVFIPDDDNRKIYRADVFITYAK